MFIHRAHIPILGIFFVLLASCGSSGSDEPIQQTPPANTAVLPITAANAQDITVAVLDAVTSSVEIVDIVDILGIPLLGSTVPGLAKPRIGFVFPPEITLCDDGQITTTWDDADDSFTISTGDTFDIVFEMCLFADTGTTLDGAASLTNMVVTGDPFNEIPPWGLATTFGFTDLSGTDSSGTSTIDGSLDLDLNSDDNLVVNLSVATASLVALDAGVTETLSEYLLTQTFDLNTLMQVINAGGTFTSTVLNGSVTFDTLQDFVVVDDDNPSAGQMLISDGNSSVLVTVIDNISVRLEIDLDLNGTVDETIVVTWAALDIG